MMSTPIRQSKDYDPVLMYAPPRVREQASNLNTDLDNRSDEPSSEPTADLPRLHRRDFPPEFSGDRAFLETQRRLTLDPEWIPEPPRMVVDRQFWMTILRTGGLLGVAAIIASGAFLIPHLKPWLNAVIISASSPAMSTSDLAEPPQSGRGNKMPVANVPRLLADSTATARQPNVPETARQPNVPETARQPNVPETARQPDVPETARQPNVPETARQPNVPERARQPNVRETARQPDVPATARQPDVPETARQPDMLRHADAETRPIAPNRLSPDRLALANNGASVGVAPNGASVGVAPNGASVGVAPNGASVEVAPSPGATSNFVKRQIERGELNAMLERAEGFIRSGDLSSARLLLRRAAEAGDVRAAFMLGSTFDPNGLKAMGLPDGAPDLAQARLWYERAVSLGSAEARHSLQQLANASVH
jgi:hypothetical protein